VYRPWVFPIFFLPIPIDAPGIYSTTSQRLFIFTTHSHEKNSLGSHSLRTMLWNDTDKTQWWRRTFPCLTLFLVLRFAGQVCRSANSLVWFYVKLKLVWIPYFIPHAIFGGEYCYGTTTNPIFVFWWKYRLWPDSTISIFNRIFVE
jgi:hypothetical protein